MAAGIIVPVTFLLPQCPTLPSLRDSVTSVGSLCAPFPIFIAELASSQIQPIWISDGREEAILAWHHDAALARRVSVQVMGLG